MKPGVLEKRGDWYVAHGYRECRLFRLHRGAANYLGRQGLTVVDLTAQAESPDVDADTVWEIARMAVRAKGKWATREDVVLMGKAIGVDGRLVRPLMAKYGVSMRSAQMMVQAERKEQAHG